ncbi:helix-turn-helix transcriptional regulator [Elizabethkingia anophelis]|uniref:helix-turn-helix transcriptional regulator n=1 Tax=Elizabethkingia anophelis TaxID=1117645 RepID=UPI0012B41ABF|nr:helix-turn-helix transcriptional regulator [Elizabethkingia anophelis]QGN22540.1 LuxR family transcriptional regulator [Elizabethkingia anophelis]QNV09192.1 LuxR family transcriptional regulator [Elizabethkingia anophelis]UTF90948.1 helix-turn-helix transcriptional regulator [Elizabethkingia anophelis]UTG01818.1 helix-turn-helix transcriptional regulator [Elizabethkingia anophelis]UTG05568.1 helix-turn-helix transcriptional regulator [Elizabethkingia anophelis]
MEIGCTQMHPVTLVAIVIELMVLGAQIVLYFQRSYDRIRLGYIILLILLIFFNNVNGILPNPAYTIPLYAQHIIVNTMGFVIVSYFPFYFYWFFGLEKLRFIAVFGVPVFLILPYVCFFLVGLTIHKDIAFTQRYGYIVPTIYSLISLISIGRSVRFAYGQHRNKNLFIEEIGAYIAIMPWAFLAPVVYFGWGQLTVTIFTNLGFLALSAFVLYRSVVTSRAERTQLESLRLIAIDTNTISRNCDRYGLSPRETEIAILLCQRLSRQEVADRLFISERTVDKHTQNIFAKANVTNRIELINKFNTVS